MPRGRYHTVQRQEILQLLSSCSDQHLTAAQIFRRLKETGTEVSRATVYRQIDALVEEGSVVRFTPEGEKSACFELVDTSGCHPDRCYHLKCEKCGRLIHLDCEELGSVADHLSSEHGFQVDMGRTVLYGICADCLRKMAP